MKTPVFVSFRGKILAAFAAALGLAWSFHSTVSVAAPADKFKTVCEGEAGRSSGSSDFIFVRERIKTGTKPIVVELSSLVANSLNFDGATVSWEPIVAPQAGYTFQKFIVKVDPANDCALAGNVIARFSTPTGTQDYNVGDPAIMATRETVFNNVMDFLGFPDVTLPQGDDAAVAEEICERVQSELADGSGLKISTAGDLGTLVGSLQANMGRCLWKSSLVDVVDTNDVKTTACSPDDMAGRLTLDILRGAPDVDLHVTSSGTGTYEITNFVNDTHAKISINDDGTCAASSNLQIDTN